MIWLSIKNWIIILCGHSEPCKTHKNHPKRVSARHCSLFWLPRRQSQGQPVRNMVKKAEPLSLNFKAISQSPETVRSHIENRFFFLGYVLVINYKAKWHVIPRQNRRRLINRVAIFCTPCGTHYSRHALIPKRCNNNSNTAAH